MEITELNLTDVTTVTAVANLYCHVFGEPPWNEAWTTNDVLATIHKPGLRWWTLTDNNVIGFIAGAINTPDAIAHDFHIPRELLTGNRIGYLAEIGINQQYRRGGFARQLSNTLLNHFHTSDVDQFVVRTRPGTGNFGWYGRLLDILHTYADGRVIFGQIGVPSL